MSKACSDCGFLEIVPERSQAIGQALLKPPYRTFLLNGTNTDGKIASKSLLIYSLPTTETEYIKFCSETASVRSKILSDDDSTVVVSFDVSGDSFVGGSVEDVLSAVSGDNEKKAALAAGTLERLAGLDKKTVDKVVASSGQKDVVIVVGSGGREHALAVALAQSPLVAKVLCCPGNGGTAAEENKKIENRGANQSNETVIELAKETGARMVVGLV